MEKASLCKEVERTSLVKCHLKRNMKQVSIWLACRRVVLILGIMSAKALRQGCADVLEEQQEGHVAGSERRRSVIGHAI